MEIVGDAADVERDAGFEDLLHYWTFRQARKELVGEAGYTNLWI